MASSSCALSLPSWTSVFFLLLVYFGSSRACLNSLSAFIECHLHAATRQELHRCPQTSPSLSPFDSHFKYEEVVLSEAEELPEDTPLP